MRRRGLKCFLSVVLILALSACSFQSQSATEKEIDFQKLEKTGSMELSYATGFSVEEYGEYSLVDIKEGERYLIVPEGKTVPGNLDSDIVVLQQPFDKTYLLSTPVADMMDELGVLDQVRMTGTREKDWYLPSVQKAMEDGTIVYTGKYNKPDYEQILSEGCNLALENTMILHNPEVKEKLQDLGIPVFIERSSYEPNPLGRLEWIKVYGLLYNREREAEAFFARELEKIEPVMTRENTGKTVAFFFITANGSVNIHKSNSYIAKMIELGGGVYGLHTEMDNALSTMNMQFEDFYADAVNADVLIYNSTIVGEMNSIEDLLDKNPLFAEFKAVKEKKVYCTSNNFFQQSTKLCDFIDDVNMVLNTGTVQNCHFLFQLR